MTVSQKGIRKLEDGAYRVAPNLILRVRTRPSGTSRTYFFRYQRSGKRTDLSLGSADVLTLQEAKEEAMKCQLLLARGIDPKEVRDAELKAQEMMDGPHEQTFQEFFDYGMAEMAKWRQMTPRVLKTYTGQAAAYALPVLGPMKLSSITVKDVVSVLEPIWKTKTPTAINLRMILEMLFSIAVREGLMTGNPATWRGNVQLYLPSTTRVHKTEHRPAIDVALLSKVCRNLSTAAGVGAKATLFCILTASRIGEATGARWDEIDFESKTWSVPPERRKDRKPFPHRVPLSDQAVALLESMPKKSVLIFAGPYTTRREIAKTSCMNAIRVALARAVTDPPEISIHGCRSTFRDWAAENGIDPALAEKALMHKTGSDTEVAYQRSDLLEQRRPVMQRWADAILPEVDP